MLKIVILHIAMTLAMTLSLSVQANLLKVNSASIRDGFDGYSNFEQPLGRKEFAQHVKNFCLNQIIGAGLDFGLEEKYMTAYVIDCAADYGVFGIELN
jgi:hypothetical protein